MRGRLGFCGLGRLLDEEGGRMERMPPVGA